MNGPQHLHAHANLWSLAAIWPHLAQAAQNAQNAHGADLGTVQAWRPGSGVYSGRTGDQIVDAVARFGGGSVNPYAERLTHADETVAWVARATIGHTMAGPLATIRALVDAVPALRPATALNVALWIGAEDRKVRELLAEKPDRQLLPGLRCPYCDTAGVLAIRSSPPPTERPIICTAGCTCDGPGCPCGMGDTVEGLPHIWTQDQLGAALDAKDCT